MKNDDHPLTKAFKFMLETRTLTSPAECCTTVRVIRPVFTGSIWYGGGTHACSRPAKYGRGTRTLCTFHARREGWLPEKPQPAPTT